VIGRLLGAARLLAKPRPPVGTTPADVVWAENKWKLLRYRPIVGAKDRQELRTPVLLVPSLINRHYVLDLLPGKSFAEWMVRRGHDVFVIDWGTPTDEDRFVTFDDVADRYLGRALRKTCAAAGSETAHVLGYCLGGTLTAIHAAARPKLVQSLVALAAPISFHDDGILSKWTRTSTFDLDALVGATGNVPWQLMQSAFHLLRPTMNLAKLVGVLDRAWDDEFQDGFLAIETWGSDNVSFPGACYQRYVGELYRENALVEDKFTLSGDRVRLSDIEAPLLTITFEHDHIVPHRSASVLLEKVSSPDKHHIHLPGGHVGAVVSKKAASGLWPAISTFWADRDG
jgi:polyhydroxyalkanoate synthase